MIAVVLQIPVGAGQRTAPDVAKARSAMDAHTFTARHESGELATFRYLGDRGGQSVYCGMASKGHGVWLKGAGFAITPLKTYQTGKPARDWLAERGVVWPNAGHHVYGMAQGDETEDVEP